MGSIETNTPAGSGRFVATQWNLVLQAAQGGEVSAVAVAVHRDGID